MLGGRQYYGLVAGLREWAFEGTEAGSPGLDARDVRDGIVGQLSRGDRHVAELFYGFNDISNIVNIRAGRSQFDEMGNLSRAELEAALGVETTGAGAGKGETPENMPGWMARVVGAYLDPDNPEYEDADTSQRFERALFEAYYAECARSGNGFLREWSRFDRNLRNVIAAHTARSREMQVADALVGSDDIVLSLVRSSAADFSLKGELEYIDTLLGAMDGANAVEKERAIDLIRWEKAGELSEFDSFGMATILAFLVRIGIIHRWAALDPAAGREMYRKLVDSMEISL